MKLWTINKRKYLFMGGLLSVAVAFGSVAGTVSAYAADTNVALQRQIQNLNPYRCYQADYNNDGEEEAFVLTDVIGGDEHGWNWRAKLYFVTANGSRLLKNNTSKDWNYTFDPTGDEIWNKDSIGIAKSNGYQAFYVYCCPPMGIADCSYVYTVNQKGLPQEHYLPGLFGKTMMFFFDEYDLEYFEEGLPDDSEYTGGVSDRKPYFFYMDEQGNLREYGAVEITKEQLLLFEGADRILKTIEKEGDIKQILYRANGYIHINVRDNTARMNYLLKYSNGSVSLVTDNIYKEMKGKSNYGTGYIRYASEYAVKPVFVPPAKTVRPTSSAVLVNGKTVRFDAYNIDGSTYFKLRDVAMAVNGTKQQFNVTWDQEKKAVNLISETAYRAAGGELTAGDGKAKKAYPCTSAIYQDGKKVDFEAYTIGDSNYFKLRDLGKAFGFEVGWNSVSNTITIQTQDTEKAEVHQSMEETESKQRDEDSVISKESEEEEVVLLYPTELLSNIEYIGNFRKCKMDRSMANAYVEVFENLPKTKSYGDGEMESLHGLLVEPSGDGYPILITLYVDGYYESFSDARVWTYQNGKASEYNFQKDFDARLDKPTEFYIAPIKEGLVFGACIDGGGAVDPLDGSAYYMVKDGQLHLLHYVMNDNEDSYYYLDGRKYTDSSARDHALGIVYDTDMGYVPITENGSFYILQANVTSANIASAILRAYAEEVPTP